MWDNPSENVGGQIMTGLERRVLAPESYNKGDRNRQRI